MRSRERGEKILWINPGVTQTPSRRGRNHGELLNNFLPTWCFWITPNTPGLLQDPPQGTLARCSHTNWYKCVWFERENLLLRLIEIIKGVIYSQKCSFFFFFLVHLFITWHWSQVLAASKCCFSPGPLSVLMEKSHVLLWRLQYSVWI